MSENGKMALQKPFMPYSSAKDRTTHCTPPTNEISSKKTFEKLECSKEEETSSLTKLETHINYFKKNLTYQSDG